MPPGGEKGGFCAPQAARAPKLKTIYLIFSQFDKATQLYTHKNNIIGPGKTLARAGSVREGSRMDMGSLKTIICHCVYGVS